MKKFFGLSVFIYSVGCVLMFSEYFRQNMAFVYAVIISPVFLAYLLSFHRTVFKIRALILAASLVSLALPSIILDIYNIFQIIDIVLIFIIINLLDVFGVEIFIRWAVRGIILGISLVVSTVLTGLVEPRFYIDPSGRFRAYLGFINPNSISLFVFAIASMILYEEFSKKRLALTLFIVITDYLITGSRSIVLAYTVLIVSWILMRKVPISKKLVMNSMILAVMIFFTLEIIVSLSPNIEMFDLLNHLMSNRLMYVKAALEKMDTVKGLVGAVERSGLILDSSYFRYFTFYGFPFLAVFFASVFYLSNVSGVHRNPEKASFLISICFYSLTEGVLDTPVSVVSILWWYTLLNPETLSHEIDHVLGGHENGYPSQRFREKLDGKINT